MAEWLRHRPPVSEAPGLNFFEAVVGEKGTVPLVQACVQLGTLRCLSGRDKTTAGSDKLMQ